MDKELLEKIARFSFIEIEEEERENFLKQIENILKDVEKILNKLSLSNVDDGSYYKRFITIFKDDLVKREYTPDEILLNSKNVKEDYIVLPKIIKEK